MAEVENRLRLWIYDLTEWLMIVHKQIRKSHINTLYVIGGHEKKKNHIILYSNSRHKSIGFENYTLLWFPSEEEGNKSLTMLNFAAFMSGWSRTKGWSISWAAVGRADGSRCKHSFRKLFASEERCSAISGISLLFAILNIAATC